ncbi:MAG: hypothetical protein KR126chlam4_00817 [Candidatus Anoxychlamydiales bacterium]|nr:hypothetical protein [Candidatus Anoxychlamydiales bacterium]NGX40985.1 hypothetical protein [Candidatus Anoxychlamydiales bacterium]
MSEDSFIINLEKLYSEKRITKKYLDILSDFYKCYIKTVNSHTSKKEISKLFNQLVKLLIDHTKNPFKFELYHKKITKPFNYQKFGIDFLKPLVDLKNSKLLGIDNLKKIQEYIDKKENVILLSNHQSEVDPLMIPILSEDKYFSLTSDIISVAGERVILDPLAIPFSMGCSLLCIYSKRYIDLDITKKHQKQIHNKKVMSLMKTLLSEGGKVIYVAPSGGRDRKNKSGKIEIAPFDYKSLEMFYLMGKKAKRKTHFFPFTLATYEIMPPPEKIQIEMGEKRVVNRRAVFISFLNELDMENFPHSDEKDRIKRRKNRAKYIHNIVKEEYERITKG